MSNPSNLYAEKIFSEHPLVLWSLDDQADYISLITEEQRDIEASWSVSGGTATVGSGIQNEPFPDSITTVINANVPVGPTSVVECVSEDIINFQNLNGSMGTFCVASYFQSSSAYLSSVSIGYEYTDTTTSTIIQNFETFSVSASASWGLISGTFEIPDENTNLRLLIKAEFLSGGGSGDYEILFNGITLGQWSENFNAKSLGVIPIELPESLGLSFMGVEADSYGPSQEIGYYLVSDNALVASNSGIPMVYGSNNTTKILENPYYEPFSYPSLIFPGKGFLNKKGQFLDYTVEFWARINCDAVTAKRIFGPIASSDGLYVEDGFITLVIGESFASHFVGEWYRPMLIQIRLIRNSASLIINGEEVINLTIDTDSLLLPEEVGEFSSYEQDWLAFYAYSDVAPIEIDCFAIYSYAVPTSVAKRRWVYGQGVSEADYINYAYGGSSAFIDYPFAGYTSNYDYPNFAKWEQGSFDNLNTNLNYLTTPSYSLPQIFLDNKNLKDLYDDNKIIQNPLEDLFVTFRPNSSWDSETTYFNFNKLDSLSSQISGIYGVFSSDQSITEEILLKIYNPLSNEYFLVKKDMDEIKYIMYSNGNEEELFVTSFVENEKFAVGINIDQISKTFGGSVLSFFGNRKNLGMYVGGDPGGSQQFDGKIYAIGLCTQYNLNKISNLFDDEGFALPNEIVSGETPSYGQQFLDRLASYTLIPLSAYNTYFLDIGVNGYWEDYMPLSYFGKFIRNSAGNEYYDLDFLQFNIGYPSPSKLLENEITSSWTYDELDEEFGPPTQKTYQQLDNSLFTNWANYGDMEERSVKFYEFDTENNQVRSYVTFQYIRDGANAPESYFTTTEPANSVGVIDIDNYPSWTTTKFEIVDNTIIYPTKSVDFNDLAIVCHLDFNIRGILHNPINIGRLQIASQALNDNSFNPVGTKFGVDIFPYKKEGIYFDYKSKNPFAIYKGTTPYLYLNRTSGIQIKGEYDPFVQRGLSIPVNTTQADNFEVKALQMWVRFDEDKFPGTATEMFEISYIDDVIKFYFVANSQQGNRGKVYAISQTTGDIVNGITYFLNGLPVRELVLTSREWSAIGISFASSLQLNFFLGAINLTAPSMLFNNVSYYQPTGLQQVQTVIARPWLKVLDNGVEILDWDYWKDFYTWNGVLVLATTDTYIVDPVEVYKTYIGTNKIVVDDNEGMLVNSDSMSVYAEVIWQENIVRPV